MHRHSINENVSVGVIPSQMKEPASVDRRPSMNDTTYDNNEDLPDDWRLGAGVSALDELTRPLGA